METDRDRLPGGPLGRSPGRCASAVLVAMMEDCGIIPFGMRWDINKWKRCSCISGICLQGKCLIPPRPPCSCRWLFPKGEAGPVTVGPAALHACPDCQFTSLAGPGSHNPPCSPPPSLCETCPFRPCTVTQAGGQHGPFPPLPPFLLPPSGHAWRPALLRHNVCWSHVWSSGD